MAHVDYTNYFGRNIIGPRGEVGDFLEPPDNPTDYAIYRQAVEQSMAQVARTAHGATQQGMICTSVFCEHRDESGARVRKAAPKDGHLGASPAYACDHIIMCDPENPEDVYYVPFSRGEMTGYLLCRTCFRLLESYKLHIQRDVLAKCGMCVGEVMDRLLAHWPDRIHDLRQSV